MAKSKAHRMVTVAKRAANRKHFAPKRRKALRKAAAKLQAPDATFF